MYEAEVNTATESHEKIPGNIKERFAEYKDRVIARTVLPWGEHCTECVWPECYSTCELYTPRIDGGCRLFIHGMVKINNNNGLNNYLLKITFKRWGKLWTVGNTRLFPVKKAGKIESRNIRIGNMIQGFPLPGKIKRFIINKRMSMKNHIARYGRKFNAMPHYFLLECYVPGPEDVPMSFIVYYDKKETLIPYQKLIALNPGFNRITIPVSDIVQTIDLRKPFKIDITPNMEKDGTTLYFGLTDFVLDKTLLSKKEKKCKCIIWDLDHTLWDGILIEDGVDKLALKPGIIDIIKQLDEKGILHSIASKNNESDGHAALEKLGIIDYFLYPRINWEPKSKSIAAIARQLNIGIDSFIFIDDQPFEREEVKRTHPGITVLDAKEYMQLPQLKQCDVPVTPESKKRRTMYKQQVQREIEKDNFLGSYFDFLKDCHITLHLFSLNEQSINRVYELAQRTNQMNFSGNRYEKDTLRRIMEDEKLHTYVMKCKDRFGEYGIIGFSIVDSSQPCLLDLMFSCRVQSKRVEHAYLSFILKKYLPGSANGFLAHYRKTERNKASGSVFYEIGFKETGILDGVTKLCFDSLKKIPDDKIIEIKEST